MASIQSPTRLNSSSRAPDLVTSAITSTSSQRLTTGLTKTESITNTNPISVEPNCIPSVQSTTQACSTLPDCTPSVPSAEWTVGPDTIEIPIWKLIYQNCHLPKQFKLFGTEPPSSSEDLPKKKSSKRTSTPLKLSLTRALKLYWLQPEKAQFWSARQFALIWDAFQFHIWVTTTDGFVFVTVQFTISSEESDKDQLCKTCLTSTTQSTKTALWSASRPLSSPENHRSDSGLDLIIPKFLFFSFVDNS